MRVAEGRRKGERDLALLRQSFSILTGVSLRERVSCKFVPDWEQGARVAQGWILRGTSVEGARRAVGVKG